MFGAACGSAGEKRTMNEARVSSAVTSLISSTTDGTCASWLAARSSGFSGASDEPKSTVAALIWAMPPPEPIDW